MNSLPSFVVIGSGLILGSTIDEIIKCGGNVKAIYLENTKDQKRFKNSFHVKNSQNINLDLNYLSENVDKNTWLISADSKKIISKEVLNIFNKQAINYHPGILPIYSGLYCYQWAVHNNEKEFGSTIHFMIPEVDYGNIIIEEKFNITNSDTGFSVYQKCLKAGIKAMRKTLSLIFESKNISQKKQPSNTSHFYQRARPYNREIDWNRPAVEIENSIRASNFYPFKPPAFQTCIQGIPIIKAVRNIELSDMPPGSVIQHMNNSILVVTGDHIILEIATTSDLMNKLKTFLKKSS